jgi:hypothetical protein
MLSAATSSRFLRGAATTARRFAVVHQQPAVFVNGAAGTATMSSRAFSSSGESASFDLTGSFQVSFFAVVGCPIYCSAAEFFVCVSSRVLFHLSFSLKLKPSLF